MRLCPCIATVLASVSVATMTSLNVYKIMMFDRVDLIFIPIRSISNSTNRKNRLLDICYRMKLSPNRTICKANWEASKANGVDRLLPTANQFVA